MSITIINFSFSVSAQGYTRIIFNHYYMCAVSVGGVVQAVSACKVLLQHLVSRVGSAPLTVTIPASLSLAHNHSSSHISAHSSSSSSIPVSIANNAVGSSSSNITTSVLSPSALNILTSNSLVQPATPPAVVTVVADSDASDSESHDENVVPASSASVATPAVSTSLAATPSNTVTVVAAVNREEKEKVVTISDKHLVLAIKALCRSKGCLGRSDQSSLIAVIRSAKLPPSIRTNTHEKDSSSSGSAGIKDGRRNRNDPSAAILEQLISPLHDLAGSTTSKGSRPSGTNMLLSEKEANSTSASDITNLFSSRCEAALQSIGGGEILLNVCLKLPSISKYYLKYKELLEGKGFGFPSSMHDVHTFKASLSQVLAELGIVSRILQLPVLEPLTSERLQKLSCLSMAGLLASLHVAVASSLTSVASAPASNTSGTTSKTSSASNAAAATSKTATASSKDEELDSMAGSITEKALLIYSIILNAVKVSTRAGGHHYQNLQLMGGWLLSSGLNQLMIVVSNLSTPSSVNSPATIDKTTKEDKGKSPIKKDLSTRINLNKVQQCISGVTVALAQQCCAMLSSLLEDVAVEGWCTNKPAPTPATMNVLETFSATERLARVFGAVPLNQLLFYLATISYRKSCSLRRSQRNLHENDTYSLTDSTIYYEDDFSEGSLGEEDDDSVIIGSWFEEPSTPGTDDCGGQRAGRSSVGGRPRPAWGVSSSNHGTAPNSSQAHSLSESESCSSGVGGSESGKTSRNPDCIPPSIPDKSEPHGYLSLATRIFSLMNSHLVECECAYVQQYVRAGLADTHMIVLAAIIKDLDRDTAKSDGGMGSELLNLYEQFSQSLYRYTHNLIASGVLSDTLQATLLHQLGVSPWLTEGDWPLQLLPRTLTVLAQVCIMTSIFIIIIFLR